MKDGAHIENQKIMNKNPQLMGLCKVYKSCYRQAGLAEETHSPSSHVQGHISIQPTSP